MEPTNDKVDGQHWTIVQELWMKNDKEQCESWKDEVQNVLIFSGLFSAVVTGFLIESQKSLRPDPVQETVQLLRQIAGQSSVAQGELTIDSQNINICVNVFWFLSLVLSLTTALIGIVSLQWIRTHLHRLGHQSESLGLSHMHSLGLQESYIPLIFTYLPVILILGLTFFLVGLIVFLFVLSRPVAIPVTIAIMFTFAFLLTTTAHPVLQRLPVTHASDHYPSSYRSPQSLLVLQFVTFLKQLWSNNHSRDITTLGGDWASRSRIWLRERQSEFIELNKPLSHLESIPKDIEVKPFAYDTIKALVSVKESRSAESEKERTALAKCLAEVLPIHLDLFPKGDLADLIPFLPPSRYVPSAVLLQGCSATREDLSAVALLQTATCNGRPSQRRALVKACVLTTRLLFELPHTFDSVPGKQPLHLISPMDAHSPDIYEVLIDTLTSFFTFAADFRPEIQSIDKTTHTSSYTYWFLALSAGLLAKCSLSPEMQAKHIYMLVLIARSLDDGKEHNYLFFTASIYACIISRSSVLCSSSFGTDFLRAVKRYRSRFPLPKDPNCEQSRLCKAVRANEVIWSDIDCALFALESKDIAPLSVNGANDATAGHCSLSSSDEWDAALDGFPEMAAPGNTHSTVHRHDHNEGYEGEVEVTIHPPFPV